MSPGGGDRTGPRVVVAPLNLGVTLSPDLEDAIPIVEQALIAELQRRSARVAVVWPPDATGLWQACVTSAGATADSADDLRTASGCFATTLAGVTSYDLLLLPSLGLREARVSGRSARWDGVRRRVGPRARAGSDMTLASPDAPVFDTGGVAAAQQWGGYISGLSLHLMGFRPGRRAPLEHWGGLDLVHDPVQVRDAVSGEIDTELRPRAELLTDEVLLREGVALALDPLWKRIR